MEWDSQAVFKRTGCVQRPLKQLCVRMEAYVLMNGQGNICLTVSFPLSKTLWSHCQSVWSLYVFRWVRSLVPDRITDYLQTIQVPLIYDVWLFMPLMYRGIIIELVYFCFFLVIQGWSVGLGEGVVLGGYGGCKWFDSIWYDWCYYMFKMAPFVTFRRS